MNKSEQFDGLLYFAQRIQEATFYYTIDIYKAPIYNTNQLAREYLRISSSVNNEIIDKKNLDEIEKEFIYSLKHDVILKKYWGDENILLVSQKLGEGSNQTKVKTIHYLTSIWDNCVYYKWCVEYVKEITKKTKEKKKIEQAIRCLLPELYAYGYSNEYIYKNLKHNLFDKKPLGFSNLDVFLSKFSLENSSYKVYLAVSKEIMLFKDILKQELNICFDDDGNFSRLKHDDQYVVVSFDEVEEKDEYRAVNLAKQPLDIFLSFYMALDNKQEISTGHTAMVYCNGKFDFIPIEKTVMRPIEKYDSEAVGEMAIEKIFSIANPSIRISDSVVVVLLKIFEKHNIALRDSNIDNAFLNLWSILEIFSESIEDGSKIEKIRKSVLMVLYNNYFKRTMKDLSKNLKSILKQDKYDYFIEKVTEEGNELFKLSCLVFFESYKDVITDLNTCLEKSPKIRSRISILNQLGGNVKELYSHINKYKDRVSWHLARLYRCRNYIIHSGESDFFINHLIEHLHSYVDILIDEFISNITDGYGLKNIDDVIIFNQIKSERLNKLINKDVRMNEEILLELLK